MSAKDFPTANLVIWQQKFAKDVSIVKPGFRSAILNEAAERLNDYRQKERQQQDADGQR